MLEPTRQQQCALRNIEGTLALVQFLAVNDQDTSRPYRSASERAVRNAGGQRTHDLRIDQYLAGGEMPYQAIAVDVFPSSGAARSAFEAVRVERRVRSQISTR